MARQPRFFVSGSVLHIIQRGNNREPIFASDEDLRFFLSCLDHARDRHQLTIHAYVLMTNHVHVVATPGQADSLPKTLQSVGRRYVQYFNRAYRRTGTLWEGRYRATLIDTEEYLLTCMRYVELNPVRAGIVHDPKDYEWSSHRANAHGQLDPIVAFHDVYRSLGTTDATRAHAYRALFQIALSGADIDLIRDTTNKNWVLGNECFKRQIEELAGFTCTTRTPVLDLIRQLRLVQRCVQTLWGFESDPEVSPHAFEAPKKMELLCDGTSA